MQTCISTSFPVGAWSVTYPRNDNYNSAVANYAQEFLEAQEYKASSSPIVVKPRISYVSAYDVYAIKKFTKNSTLVIKMNNAEDLLKQDPQIFDGLELEIVDENDDDYFEEEEKY